MECNLYIPIVMTKAICFFDTAIPWGGGEKWHFEMAKYLHETGHTVWIFCHQKSVLYEKAKTQVVASWANFIESLVCISSCSEFLSWDRWCLSSWNNSQIFMLFRFIFLNCCI